MVVVALTLVQLLVVLLVVLVVSLSFLLWLFSDTGFTAARSALMMAKLLISIRPMICHTWIHTVNLPTKKPLLHHRL